jgi:small subunit ribosomal protein S13
MYPFQSELFKKKPLKLIIQSIYGLSKFYTQIMFKILGFSSNLKSSYATNSQLLELVYLIDKSPILKESALKKHNFSIFQKLIEIKTVKSRRLLNGLPVRGQRTHTNSKTSKKKLFFIK